MDRKTFIKLSSAGLIILAVNLISGLFSLTFFHLLSTLVVIPVVVYLVASSGIPVFLRGILSVFGFILNDILFKIFLFYQFSDISLSLFIFLAVEMLTFLFSAIVFLIGIRKDFKILKGIATVSFLIFCVVSSLYLYLVGYKQIYPIEAPASMSIMVSKKKGMFISELKSHNPLIILQKDTFILKNAWLEKEISLERRPLISHFKETGRYRIAVKFDHHIEHWGYSNKYAIYPDGDRSGGVFLMPDGLFSFVTDSLANEYPITIVRLNKDSITFIVSRNPEQQLKKSE